jgi:type IV pilus assembly PilX-like protein
MRRHHRARAGAAGRSDAGAALLIALIALVLLCGLGFGLVTMSHTESIIASNYRIGSEMAYAADAAIEFVTSEVGRVARWTDVLTGNVGSALTDSTLHPLLPWGASLDLIALTGHLQAATDLAYGLGANNPRWRLFAYGWLSQVTPASLASEPAYVSVWVADDRAEIDGDPWSDTNGVVMAVARATGARGAVRTVEATLAHPNPGSGSLSDVRMVSWREVR